jgi:hypothetical protein
MLALPVAATVQTPPTLSLRCCSRITANGVGSQTASAALAGPEIPRFRISVVTSLHTGGVALLSISILMKPRFRGVPATSSAPVEITAPVGGTADSPVHPVSRGVLS